MLDHEFTKQNGERSFGGARWRRCVHFGGRGNCGDGVLYPGRKRELEQVGLRKLKSQAGAELGPQEHQSSFAAPADGVAAGLLAACEALSSWTLGDLQGIGKPAAALARLVDTLWRLEETTSGWCLEEDLEDLEMRLCEFEAAAEVCTPVRFLRAVVVKILVNLDVRDRRTERDRAAATASKGVVWGAGDACIPLQRRLSLVSLCRPSPYLSSTFNNPFPHSIPSYPIPPHLIPSHPILSLHATQFLLPFRSKGTGLMLLSGGQPSGDQRDVLGGGGSSRRALGMLS